MVGASVIARDITERKRALAQIAHLAYYDQLTGLPNRAMFHEHLELGLARADRNGMAVAVLFIDLDNFKLVNDSFGHVAGDTLLHDFGQRLKAVTRATDIVARQGGDEFLVLVPDLELHGGESLEPRALEVVAAIEQKVRAVLATPFQVAGTDVHVGLSIGVSVYPIDAADRDELLRNADTAMYVGKGLHLVRPEPAEPQAKARRQAGDPERPAYAPSSRAPSSCTTSRSSTSPPASWWAWRRCFAGATTSTSWCCPSTSSRWPSATA